jgi:hypothetical protein
MSSNKIVLNHKAISIRYEIVIGRETMENIFHYDDMKSRFGFTYMLNKMIDGPLILDEEKDGTITYSISIGKDTPAFHEKLKEEIVKYIKLSRSI